MKMKLQYLKYPFLKNEIERMGYQLKGGVILKTFLPLYGSVFLISYFYQLKPPYLFFLLFISTIIAPYHIFHEYKNQYQKKKYLDLTVYMEQMLYSFQRHPKIVDALNDTGFVFTEGEMKKLIEQAKDKILSGDSKNLFLDALEMIELGYPCQRLRIMHNFFIKVEERGGEYKETANLLLDDRQRWKTSTEILENEKKGKKRAIHFVLISTMIICGVMISIFSALDGIHVTSSFIYQIFSASFVTGNLFIWMISSDKLGEVWEFIPQDCDDMHIVNEYKLFKNIDIKKEKKKNLKWLIIPTAVLIAGIALKKISILILGVFYLYYLWMSPKYRIQNAKRKVMIEVKKIFPQWLMELTLLLQTENVYVALTQSMQGAPVILKQEIKKLLEEIDEKPNSVEPYHKFFYELHLEEVTTCMKILYSISAFDVNSGESPIRNLIQRNHVMLNQSELEAGEEKLAVWTSVSYVPMAVGGMKIILDMVLLIASLIASITAI